MTTATEDPIVLHDRQAKAVSKAVAQLLVKLGPDGFTPEAIFEGAVSGAAVQLITAGATAENVADLLNDMADTFRQLERPSLHVVQ